MDQSLVASIRESLKAKSTAELREAYESGDTSIWSPEAFEAMRQLLAQPPNQGTLPAAVCSSCALPSQSLGKLPLRIGGTSGSWHFLVGVWAEASERVLPLDVYRCPKCKRVEFFDVDDRLSTEANK